MLLGELKTALQRHKVTLSRGENGRLRYDAPAPFPSAVLQGIREHRDRLLEELPPTGQPDSDDLTPLEQQAAARPDLFGPLATGVCWTCGHWQQDPAYVTGDMGNCTAEARHFAAYQQPTGATQARLRCPGTGWRANPDALPAYR